MLTNYKTTDCILQHLWCNHVLCSSVMKNEVSVTMDAIIVSDDISHIHSLTKLIIYVWFLKYIIRQQLYFLHSHHPWPRIIAMSF